MDSGSVKRALFSSGLWLGVTYGICVFSGVEANLTELATDAGLMGASALASDVLLQTANMAPTAMVSAASTGAIYAGAQRLWRGDDSLLVNFIGASANDFLVSTVDASMA
jgi:hypothetical protein